MTKSFLRLGSRKSPLATLQSLWVADQLRKLGFHVECLSFITEGDRLKDKPLRNAGGKVLFTREIEQAILDGHIDFAVHSLKDVSGILPPGLVVAAVPPRGNVRDVWISRRDMPIHQEPAGTRVGTSSLRRQIQLRQRWPHLLIQDIRGNIHTRLKKMDKGQVDALVLALVGLERLQLLDRVTETFSVADMLPAVGQGALALECHEGNRPLRQILETLNHRPTAICTQIERGFLRALDGNCLTPIGGYARFQGDIIVFDGLLGTATGIRRCAHTYVPAATHGDEKATQFGWEKGMALLQKAP